MSTSLHQHRAISESAIVSQRAHEVMGFSIVVTRKAACAVVLPVLLLQ